MSEQHHEAARMESDLRVLKNEVAGMQRSIDALATSTSKGMEAIAAKMDQFLGLQLEIVKMQEQQTHADQAIGRAFEAIGDVEKLSEVCATKLSNSLAFARGAALVAMFALGGLQWYVLQQIDQIKNMSGDLTALDRRVTMHDQVIQDRISRSLDKPKGEQP